MKEALLLVIKQYNLPEATWDIRHFGTGLINHTWLVSAPNRKEKYICQKINESVFKQPEYIAENINSIGSYLQKHYPAYFFIQPLQTHSASGLVWLPDSGYYRMMPFAEGSHTVDTVTDTGVAFEAAKQFARFTANLRSFPVEKLHITLPDFHNLRFRLYQYRQALHYADPKMLKHCDKEIKVLQKFHAIELRWEGIYHNPLFPKRVIHHDTKISNCLFDDRNKGMAVIDLDTVMPGYYMSDVGDMCRSYLCALNEESTAFDEILIRLEYFDALADGYLSEMGNVLTPDELELFTYSGQFLMYMQALRFLADFLAGNPYYPVSHPMHNLDRTKNQLALLKQFCALEDAMRKIVQRHLRKYVRID